MSNPDDAKKDDVKKEEIEKKEQSEEVAQDNLLETSSHEAVNEEAESASDNKKSDNFFEDEGNAKKKSSPLIPFILLIFLCGAFLVFGYIYNIAGIRDKASEYNFEKIPNYFESVPEKHNDSPLSEQANFSSVKDNISETEILTQDNDDALLSAESVNEDAVQLDKADNVMDQIDDSKDDLIEEKPAIDNVNDIVPVAAPIIKTVTEYVPAYALSKEEFLVHKEKIRALNKEIYSGKTYINQLVAVKGLFPELDLSVMTEYSAIGKPKKFTVAQNGIHAVKRAAVLQEVKTDAKIQDIADAVLRKFVVITPTENIDENALDGQLSLIKNAFMAGDFKAALKYISILPEDRKREFVRVVKVINDMYRLKAEMRQVDDALTEKLYNNKKN